MEACLPELDQSLIGVEYRIDTTTKFKALLSLIFRQFVFQKWRYLVYSIEVLPQEEFLQFYYLP